MSFVPPRTAINTYRESTTTVANVSCRQKCLDVPSDRGQSMRAHRRMVRLRSFSGVGIHELSLFCRRGHIGEWTVCVPSLVLGFTSCRCSVDAATSANGPSAFLL